MAKDAKKQARADDLRKMARVAQLRAEAEKAKAAAAGPQTSTGEAVFQGAAQGLTFQTSDEITAAIQAASSTLSGPESSLDIFLKQYQDNVKKQRDYLAKLKQEHPYAFTGSQVATGVAKDIGLSLIPGLGVIRGAKSLTDLAKVGGGLGAAEAFGGAQGESGEVGTVLDTIGETVVGGAMGATGGAVLGKILGPGLQRAATLGRRPLGELGAMKPATNLDMLTEKLKNRLSGAQAEALPYRPRESGFTPLSADPISRDEELFTKLTTLGGRIELDKKLSDKLVDSQDDILRAFRVVNTAPDGSAKYVNIINDGYGLEFPNQGQVYTRAGRLYQKLTNKLEGDAMPGSYAKLVEDMKAENHSLNTLKVQMFNKVTKKLANRTFDIDDLKINADMQELADRNYLGIKSGGSTVGEIFSILGEEAPKSKMALAKAAASGREVSEIVGPKPTFTEILKFSSRIDEMLAKHWDEEVPAGMTKILMSLRANLKQFKLAQVEAALGSSARQEMEQTLLRSHSILDVVPFLEDAASHLKRSTSRNIGRGGAGLIEQAGAAAGQGITPAGDVSIRGVVTSLSRAVNLGAMSPPLLAGEAIQKRAAILGSLPQVQGLTLESVTAIAKYFLPSYDQKSGQLADPLDQKKAVALINMERDPRKRAMNLAVFNSTGKFSVSMLANASIQQAKLNLGLQESEGS